MEDENPAGGSRMIEPVDPIMVDPPVVSADPTNPDMTGTGIMGAEGMSLTTVEPGYVNEVSAGVWDMWDGTANVETAMTVASFQEMMDHSRYRATTNGKVYDLAGTNHGVEEMWTDAKRSVDEAKGDLKEAMEGIGEDFNK